MNENPDKSLPVSSELAPRRPGLRLRIGAWWQHWRPRLRMAERALLVMVVLAAMVSAHWRQGLTGIWISLNIGYGLIAAVWVMVHGRAVWHTRDSALRWAVCLSVIGGLLIYTVQYKALNNLNTISVAPGEVDANGAIWLLPIWFALFCVFWVIALLGAAIGSFAGRRSGDSERSARAGITLSMASAIVFMLALTFTPDNPGLDMLGLSLCFFSFPLLTRLYIHTLQSSARPLRHWLQPFTRALTRCLVWRWRIPISSFGTKRATDKTLYTLDLRGVVLGLAIATLVLNVPPRFTGPLQSLALTTLTRLHTARNLPFVSLPHLMRPAPGPRDRFVILRMDAQTRYDASQRSEAAVQADMIELLRKRGAARIVLPLPYLYNRMIDTWTSRNEGLAPNSHDVERNRRDAGRLAAVLRRSPDVVLAVPPIAHADDTIIQRLETAAPTVGNATMLRSPATYLPVVPETWTGRPPLPALLCADLQTVLPLSQPATLPDTPPAGAHPPANSNPPPIIGASTRGEGHAPQSGRPPAEREGHGKDIIFNPQLTSLRDIPGCARPQVYPDSVMIDFVGEGPREDFLRATYAEVRANAPMLSLRPAATGEHPAAPPPPTPPGKPQGLQPPKNSEDSEDSGEAEGEWKPAADMLRGRVVFLDSTPHPMVSTSAGVMTLPEAQAYATATLLSQEAFQRAPPLTFELLTLLLGMAVGYTCARHEPLESAIRLLIPLFLVIAGSIAEYLLGGYWFDPVLPLLTMAATAALATQFRFTRERVDKLRVSELFGRFVAPHMLQAWLKQHGQELQMGGVREKICVLFADARQFTAFAEQHDATEVLEVINAYMTALTDALHAHGGILDKYTGDGLMAFFQLTPSQQKETTRTEQAALAVQEDISRAVSAALAMREAVLALSTWQARNGKPVLNFGISLHYGDAIVGLVGNSKQQVNYTAMGLTVVVAARLQSIANGGDIIVSEEVFQETRDAFVFVVGEPVQVKGLTQAVRPYRVLAPQSKEDEGIKH